MRHMLLPVRPVPNGSSDRVTDLRDRQGLLVAEVYNRFTDDTAPESNIQRAEDIAKAVNFHQELVAKLKALWQFMPPPEGPKRLDKMDTSAAYLAYAEATRLLEQLGEVTRYPSRFV